MAYDFGQPAPSQAPLPEGSFELAYQPPVATDPSSGFGSRVAPMPGASTFHQGIDYPAPIGSPVAATDAGTVISAGPEDGYGNTVRIKHPDGRTSLYAHLGAMNVKANDVVRAGDPIAAIGATGRETGPHVHFGIMDAKGQFIDPNSVYDSAPDAAQLEQHILGQNSTPSPSAVQITQDKGGVFRDTAGTPYTVDGDYYVDPSGNRYEIDRPPSPEEIEAQERAHAPTTIDLGGGRPLSPVEDAWYKAHPNVERAGPRPLTQDEIAFNAAHPFTIEAPLVDTGPLGALAAFGRAGANAFSGGWANKFEAGTEAALPGLYNPPGAPIAGKTFDERYDLALRRQDAIDAQGRSFHPVASVFGQAPGYVGQALAAPEIKTATMAGALIKPALLGAAYGALNASGNARGDFGSQVAQTGEGALGGAALGALGGAAFGHVAPASSRSALAGVDVFTPVPPKVASQAADYVLSRAGTPNQALVSAAGSGKDVMLADMLGQPGVGALATIGRRSGATAQPLQDAVEARAASAPQSIADDYAQRAGVQPGEARGQIEAYVQAGREKASPLYKAAFEQSMPDSPQLASLVARPSMQSAVARADELARERGLDPAQLGIARDAQGRWTLHNPTMETVDWLKKGLDDVIEDYRDPVTRALPRTNKVDGLQGTRTAFRNLVTGDSSPGTRAYGAALRESGDYLSANDAYEYGRTMTFNNATKPEDFARRFAALRPAEQDAFRAGQARAISELQGSNRLKPGTFMMPNVQDKLRVVLGEDGARDFLEGVNHTRQLIANAQRMNPNINSITSNVGLESKAQDAFGGSAVKNTLLEAAGDTAMGTLASGGHPGAGLSYAGLKLVNKGVRSALEYAASGGLSEAARDEAGRILMSKMTPDALAAYVRSAKALKGAPQKNTLAIPLSAVLGTQPRQGALEGVSVPQ